MHYVSFLYIYIVVASKEAGPGKLSVNVRAGGADVDSVVREGDNGVYEIVFHPTRAAPHKIHIKYNEVHIPGKSYKLCRNNRFTYTCVIKYPCY